MRAVSLPAPALPEAPSRASAGRTVS
jgi:hypothetical protein